MTWKQAQKRLKKLNKERVLKDFKHRIQVNHGDGTTLTFNYAWYDTEEEFLFVCTEHNGDYMFHSEDLEGVFLLKCLHF